MTIKDEYLKEENKVYKIYKLLYSTYGQQGWWPFIDYKYVNTSKNQNTSGYHIGKYDFPRDNIEVFEVCLGSILTQNTTFISVIKSLHNLKALTKLTPEGITELNIEQLKIAIKPSGYYNQKTRYIFEFISFFTALNGKVPTREALLNVVGIGEETADSILLYGYNQEEFIIDSYTMRVLFSLGLIDEKAKYKDVKEFMQTSIKACVSEKKERIIVYQEYHALIVKHAKMFYSKKPYGVGCMLYALI